MNAIGRFASPDVRAVLQAEGLRTLTFIPLAADNDWWKTSTQLTTGLNKTTTITTFTHATCQSLPQTVIGVVTENSGDTWTAVSIVLQGINQFGQVVSETLTGTNTSGTWTCTGSVCWLQLLSAAITITGTGDTGDAVILGFGKTYGLCHQILASTDVLFQSFDGSADDGTVSVANASYAFDGTPNAAKVGSITLRTMRPY